MFFQKNVVLSILLLATLAIASPSAQSYAELIGAEATWGGHQVEYFNPNIAQAINIEIHLDSDEEFDEMNFELKGFNRLGSQTGEIESCLINKQTKTCLIPNIILHTNNESPLLQLVISNNQHSYAFNHSLSFTLDQSSPQVTALEAGICQEECYISSGDTSEVRISLQDNTGSFYKKKISYRLGSERGLVYDCTDTLCTGRVYARCGDGSRPGLSITAYRGSYSQDDAGNPLTGLLSREVICDNEDPIFSENFTLSSTSKTPVENEAAQRPFISLSDTLIIEFNATDTVSPTLKVKAKLSSLGLEDVNGTCTKKEDYFSCSVSVSPLLDQAKENVIIPLVLTDMVGRTTRKELVIDVLEGNEETAEFWTLLRNPRTIRANKHFLEFTPKKLYYTVELDAETNQEQVILASRPGQCRPVEKNGVPQGRTSDISDMNILSTSDNTLLITSFMNMGSHYAQYEKTQYNCSVEVLSRAGSHISRHYETISYILNIDFHDTQTLGEMVSGEIEEVLNKQNEQAKKVAEFKKVVDTLTVACKYIIGGKTAGGAMSTVGASLRATGVLEPVGKPVAESGAKISGLVEDIPYGTQACLISSCTSDFNYILVDKIGNLPGVEESSQLMGYKNFRETLNPYNSLVTSAMMMCPSGLLYHMERWQGVECEYAACLSRDVGAGLAQVEDCQKIRSYNQCIYIYGGVFNAVPLANAFKETMSVMVETISNPVSLFTTGGSVWACKAADPTGGIAKTLCEASSSIKAAIDTYNKYASSIKQIKQVFSSNIGKSACDTVQERISNTDTYWNYVDEEDEPFTYENNYNGYVCNGLGCTKTFGEGDNKKTYTYVPVDNGQDVRVFEGGRELTDYDPQAHQLGVGAAQSYHNDWEAQARAQGYEDYLSYSNQAFEQFAESKSKYDGLVRAEISANSSYNQIRDVRDNIEDIGKYNDEIDDSFEDFKEEYEEYSQDVREAVAQDSTDPAYTQMREAVSQVTGSNFPHGTLPIMTDEQLRELSAHIANLDSQLGLPSKLNSPSARLKRVTNDRDDTITKVTSALDDNPKLKEAVVEELGTGALTLEEQLQGLGKDQTKILADTQEIKDVQEGLEEQKEEELEQATKEREDEEDYVEDANDARLFSEFQERDYGNLAKTMRTTLRFARNINQFAPSISNIVFGEYTTTKWRHAVEGMFDDLGTVGDILRGNWEQAVCERELGSGDQTLLVSQLASTTYANAAHIEGLQIIEDFVGDELNYSYIINAYVVNYDVDRELVFDITLKGPSGERSLLENYEALAQGEVYDRTKSRPLLYTSTEEYDHACLVFHTDALHDWFPVTAGNNKFCRRLTIE